MLFVTLLEPTHHPAALDGLVDLNAFLVRSGFALNDAGGRIKGSPDVYQDLREHGSALMGGRSRVGDRLVRSP